MMVMSGPWQREAVWRGFVERINKTVGELGAVELVGLGQFICGLNTEETGQLNTDAFRSDMDSVCVCLRELVL